MTPRLLTVPGDLALLRRKAKKVKNPQSTEVILGVQAMKRFAVQWEAEHPGSRCEGVAAPQIGLNLRIVIVRNSNEMVPSKPACPAEDATPEEIAAVQQSQHEYDEFMRCRMATFNPWVVMYNPVFGESDGLQDSDEGCLSVPGVSGKTLRPETVTFHYYDQNLSRCPARGNDEKPHEFVARGHSACIVTHELDHLNGVLFTDSAFETAK